jgi:hypothetical protein
MLEEIAEVADVRLLRNGLAQLAQHDESCVLERAPTDRSLREHQKSILQMLVEAVAPLSHKALCEAWGQSGLSQSTFDRAFRELKDLSAINKGERGGEYEITDMGKLLIGKGKFPMVRG